MLPGKKTHLWSLAIVAVTVFARSQMIISDAEAMKILALAGYASTYREAIKVKK